VRLLTEGIKRPANGLPADHLDAALLVSPDMSARCVRTPRFINPAYKIMLLKRSYQPAAMPLQ
jgi:hypothetical protein